jgi:hypothetical protein
MEKIGQFMVGNPKQPGGKTALITMLVLRAIGGDTIQSCQKGLRSQVLSVLLVPGPGQVIDVDTPVMALVKCHKLAGVLYGLCGQDKIGRLGIFHNQCGLIVIPKILPKVTGKIIKFERTTF